MKTNLEKGIKEIIKEENLSDDEVLKSLRKVVNEIELKHWHVAESITIVDSLKQYRESLVLGEYNDLNIPTGYKDLDLQFGGFSKGELIILGSRPSMGKTQFMVNLALRISEKKQLLFFTYDLPIDLLVNRFISCVSGYEASGILSGNTLPKEESLISKAMADLRNHKLSINVSGNNSVSSIKEICKKHVDASNVEIVFIDYLQLMGTPDNYEDRHHEIGYIVRELKNMAREYKICVFVSSQLNRFVESRGGTKRPYLSDLRDSGTIEEYADKVLFLYRPDYYHITEDCSGKDITNLVEIIVAKNRNGKSGNFILEIDENFTNFTETNR